MAVQGMNEKIDMRDWNDEEKYLLVQKSEKGYSGVFNNNDKLSKKRVIVHKALEQTLSGKEYVLLSCEKMFERDKFYLLSDAEEVEPTYSDIVQAIKGSREIVKKEGGFLYQVHDIDMLENVYVVSISFSQYKKELYYVFWYDENEKLHFFRDDRIVRFTIFAHELAWDIMV